ncbi:MAG: MGMT family protein [Candidatus Methanomethylicaceae archaeon]
MKNLTLLAKKPILGQPKETVTKMLIRVSTIRLGSEWFSLAYTGDLLLIANSIPCSTPEESQKSLICSLSSRGVKNYQESPPDPSIVRQFESALNSGLGSIKLYVDGISRFNRQVLGVTAMIPLGNVATYRDIAIALGKPKAQRAVGNALARNPFPVIIPCHRVIRSDLSLGGYSGACGTDANIKIKEALLRREGIKIKNGKVMEKFLLASGRLSCRSSLYP